MAAALIQSKIDGKEIGDLLLQVQDELKSLRNMIAKDGQNVDIKQLQNNIKKAEDDIKVENVDLLRKSIRIILCGKEFFMVSKTELRVLKSFKLKADKIVF